MLVRTNHGTGSGVIIETSVARGSALVLTNEHVIRGAARITVIVYDSVPYQAEILGYDTDRDVALLQICCWGNFEAVDLAAADNLAPGSEVITMGYPFAIKGEATVTRGIVSAVRFEPDNGRWVIQTDAPINSGNSGGPMFSMTGEVVGINTYKYRLGIAEGLGFAVSNKTIGEILASLKTGLASNFVPPTPVPGTATPYPTPSPTATPTPKEGRYFLTINGASIASGDRLVATSFGSVKVQPAPSDDGAYSFNTVVTLTVWSNYGDSFIWTGVDAQNGADAMVQMYGDKEVMVRIGRRWGRREVPRSSAIPPPPHNPATSRCR